MIYDRHAFEDLDWECPYCGKAVRLVMLDSTNKESADDPRTTMAGVSETEVYDEHNNPESEVSYIIAECPRASCKGKVFATVHWNRGELNQIVEAYPYPNVRSASFPDSIPANIREDFAEASRCYHVAAYKAVVAMCRRVVQDIAREKNVEGRDPSEQIKQLYAQHLITQDMFETAQHVNKFGAFGVHPQTDALDTITPDLASRVLEVTHRMLLALYVLRGDNKIFNKQIQQIRQPSGANSSERLASEDK
jgi:hypothetical protein